MNRDDAIRLIRPILSQRVVFAHQSVGADLLAGVAAIASAADLPIRIEETRSPSNEPGVYHFRVGRNRAPHEKLRDFETALAEPSMQDVDAVLFKLCYVDIDANASVAALAEAYLETLERLRRALPNTRFVGMTCPLTTVQSGVKAKVKTLLGVAPHGYAENAQRHAFNEILRANSRAQDLFDLASLEANNAGAVCSFQYQGQRIPALSPTLTRDGGHLNEVGRIYIAGEMLQFLARESRVQSSAAVAQHAR